MAIDTKAMADELGTDTKSLRRFLRHPSCPVQPVGSGARYTFRDDDVEPLREGFKAWAKGKPAVSRGANAPAPKRVPKARPNKDTLVWAEEEAARLAKGQGPVTLDDIRNPRVRARVRAEAARQEAALSALLMARGLHITQLAERA